MCLPFCLGKDKTDEKFIDTNAYIKDLNKLVKMRAWNNFQMHRTMKRKRKWFCFCWKERAKQFSMDCDWSGVKFIPDEPEFVEGGYNGTDGISKPLSNVIFKSVFKNEGPFEQQHSLKAERQTTSCCKSSITKGYTRGLNVGLSISAPNDIAKAAVGFSKGFKVDDVVENADNKTLTWTAEGLFKVGKESTLVAEIHIIEYHRQYEFETWVAGMGTVKTSILNRDKKCVYEVTDDVRTLIHEEFNDDPDAKKEDKENAYIKVKGKCEFQYGIEQEICLSSITKL